MPMSLAFEPLYYGERLKQVNPTGDIGLITLWSPQATVERKLESVVPGALDPTTGRVAVIANLYGDGMFAMLCNLLYNPQIRHLVAVGQDLGLGVPEEIAAFLDEGLEESTMFGQPLQRIAGTNRLFPVVPEFDAARLRAGLTFHYLGKVSEPSLGDRLGALLATLPADGPHGDGERVEVVIPTDDSASRSHQPSDPFAHQVTRASPMECWHELVVRTVRFGQPTELAKGTRFELLNAKVVITDPRPDSPESLKAVGFDIERFHHYEQAILDPALPDNISYTYGNRLRGHYEVNGELLDTIDAVVTRLSEDPESRTAYISLWDTAADLGAGAGRPCLTTLFFRRHAGQLTLTATYRAHNLLTAWLMNVYGLMAIQRTVAERVGMPVGPITVISHSLSIDPSSTSRYAVARAMEAGWTLDDDHDPDTGKYTLREDPNGYFVVSTDDDGNGGRGELIVEHRIDGLLLKRYTGHRAGDLGREIAADMAVSLVSHAIWLGGELQKYESAMAARRGVRASAGAQTQGTGAADTSTAPPR